MFYYRATAYLTGHTRRTLRPGVRLITRSRPLRPLPTHLSPDGRATLCGLPTSVLVLVVSDPVQYFTTDLPCQKCLHTLNHLQPTRPASISPSSPLIADR